MDWIYTVIFVLISVLMIVYVIIRLRNRLLTLWRDVTYREIIFHRLLGETILAFYQQKEQLRNEENRVHFVRLGRSRHKKMRHLLLKERQELYQYLSDLHNEILEKNNNQFTELKQQFSRLRKARKKYNSNVLIYNQTISIFPTRYLAMKMNLKVKEYFG